jgi:hypothetical protein
MKKIYKNKVIEIAIKIILDDEIRNDLQRIRALASNDKELIEMAQRGFGRLP